METKEDKRKVIAKNDKLKNNPGKQRDGKKQTNRGGGKRGNLFTRSPEAKH